MIVRQQDEMSVEKPVNRVLPAVRRRGAFILMAIGFSLLSFINAATLVHMVPTLGALGLSIIFGLGSGLSSIINGTLPLYLFGKNGYGELTGRIAAVRLTVTATAPFIYALLMENLGVTFALGFMAVLGICAIVSSLAG